ncbi:UNVERIFIED_CONTAM: hypothetical protein FKN15_077363 [Acipenser sinensis]
MMWNVWKFNTEMESCVWRVPPFQQGPGILRLESASVPAGSWNPAFGECLRSSRVLESCVWRVPPFQQGPGILRLESASVPAGSWNPAFGECLRSSRVLESCVWRVPPFQQGGQRAMRVFGFSIGGVVLLTLFPIVCCRIMQGSKASNTLRQENQDVKAARQKAKEPDENIGSFVLDLLKEEQVFLELLPFSKSYIEKVELCKLQRLICVANEDEGQGQAHAQGQERPLSFIVGLD